MLTKTLSQKRITLRDHHIGYCKIVLLLEEIQGNVETLNVQDKGSNTQ